MKVAVVTLGCKVNQCESDGIVSLLKAQGYEVTEDIEYADAYIINTCAVTLEAEKKSRQMIARVRKYNANAPIYVTGCASEHNAKQFEDKRVKYVSGNAHKSKLAYCIDKTGVDVETLPLVFEDDLPASKMRTRQYIKIQDGCNNFCSYCIVPYLRGRSRSRAIDSIVKEINESKANEIVLTGIDISSYDSNGEGLSGLIDALKDIDKRIRLSSLEVRVISEKLLKSLSNLKHFCPHFHLSLQSGSESVLKSMNRKYTPQEYFDRVQLIRKYFPNCALTTDIITGFAGETEKNAIETEGFVKQVGFSDIHIFPYSPRIGTVAYGREVPNGNIVNDRKNRLNNLKIEAINNFFKANIGLSHQVLLEEEIDGKWSGYTENYIKVYIEGRYVSGDILNIITTEERYGDGVIAEEKK